MRFRLIDYVLYLLESERPYKYWGISGTNYFTVGAEIKVAVFFTSCGRHAFLYKLSFSGLLSIIMLNIWLDLFFKTTTYVAT